MKTIIYSGIAMFAILLLSQNATAQLSDPEIASVAVVANQNDISYAEIALQRSSNKAVREFANTMVKDHNSVIDQAVALVGRLNVTPEDNDLSKALTTQAEETVKTLNTVSKSNFDKTYIDNEVAYHEAVINAVKTVLIPDSQNEDLRELLEGVLPVLEVHLEHAKMVQGNMSK